MAESSNERLRRLLTLVPWLASHSGITKTEAAAHFEMTVAALEADLALVSVTGPGLYGGELVDIYFEDETVTVYDAQGLLQPLQLSAEESSTLLLGLQALQQLPDSDAALIARLMDKLGLMPDAAVTVQVLPSPFADLIGRAIDSGHDLEFDYTHPVRDEVSHRLVTPGHIVTTDGRDYLIGWCHGAEASRTFRLDRMRDCRLGGPTTSRPELPLALGTPANQARIELPATAEYLLESVPATVTERGSLIRATVEFGDDAWLVAWLVACGAHVRCLSPERIGRAVAVQRASARDAYAALVRGDAANR